VACFVLHGTIIDSVQKHNFELFWGSLHIHKGGGGPCKGGYPSQQDISKIKSRKGINNDDDLTNIKFVHIVKMK